MSKPVQSREQFFKALADETRLRLIHLMNVGEICVCYLVEVLGQPQSKISRHLAYLRQAGIVSARRDGKWMHYRLTPQKDPGAARVLRQVLAWLGGDKKMQSDRARLHRTCCIPENSALGGAPSPVLRVKPAQKKGAPRNGK
jgi:ArsR family transcriptional regulator